MKPSQSIQGWQRCCWEGQLTRMRLFGTRPLYWKRNRLKLTSQPQVIATVELHIYSLFQESAICYFTSSKNQRKRSQVRFKNSSCMIGRGWRAWLPIIQKKLIFKRHFTYSATQIYSLFRKSAICYFTSYKNQW